MKKFSLICLLVLLISMNTGAQNTSPITGNNTRIEFKQISIIIPNNWVYEVRPNLPPDYDSIRIIDKDGSRIIYVTYQKFDFKNFDFVEWEHTNRFSMLQRAMSYQYFKNAKPQGNSLESSMWGRKGNLTEFDLYRTENYDQSNIIGKVINYGEPFINKGMALSINAIIPNSDISEITMIVKSIIIKD